MCGRFLNSKNDGFRKASRFQFIKQNCVFLFLFLFPLVFFEPSSVQPQVKKTAFVVRTQESVRTEVMQSSVVHLMGRERDRGLVIQLGSHMPWF